MISPEMLVEIEAKAIVGASAARRDINLGLGFTIWKGGKRSFPNLPTFMELGIKAKMGQIHRIVMAPKGLSNSRIQKLQAAFAKLLKDKTFKKMMKRLDENTELMMGDEYDRLRPIQKKEYNILVKQINGR